MSDLTPVADEATPPSDSTDQPSQEATETVESLKEKLAAAEALKLKAEEEAKTWKGRVKDENPKKKADPDEAYSDWRIDNRDRIAVPGIKEAYEQELQELEASGAKLTIPMREKALKLAEAKVGVKKVESSQPLPSGTIERGGLRQPTLTEHDIAFGVKPETKKKYAQLVEG